jgi:hypothetical protein
VIGAAFTQSPLKVGNVICGNGLTVIVYDDCVPVHPFAEGVTVIVATMAVVPVFDAVNPGIFPVPLLPNPMEGVVFVQEKVVPGVVLVKFAADTAAPVHKLMFDGTVTVAVGFTVILKEAAVPLQPLAEGITEIVPIIGADPVLVPIKLEILPVPLAASPMATLVLVALLQTVTLVGTLTAGVGFTVMLNEDEVPVHPLAVGVTVMVADIGKALVLVAINPGMFPLPLPASPMDVLLFVHAKVAPGVVLLKLLNGTEPLLQTVTLAGTVMFGIGFTVTVTVLLPVQPRLFPVTV